MWMERCSLVHPVPVATLVAAGHLNRSTWSGACRRNSSMARFKRVIDPVPETRRYTCVRSAESDRNRFRKDRDRPQIPIGVVTVSDHVDDADAGGSGGPFANIG